MTRWFAHLKSATVYHSTFVVENVRWYNDKLELVYLPKQILCIPEWFTGWPLLCPPPHFGWPKMNFERISSHFRSIHNFLFLYFFYKMTAGGYFGWLNITFDHIYRHFRSIHNFFLKLFTKWQQTAILDDRKSLSIAFLAISDQYSTLFFSQNGCQRPFWMTENHFWSHFSPF